MVKLYSFIKKYANIKNIILLNSVIFIIVPFFLDDYRNIFKGILKIMFLRSVLITDHFVVGGICASFVNAGLIMLIAIILKIIAKSTFSGNTISCIYLVTGFSFVGKNIFNIWPIIIGVLIFSKINETTFSANINLALYGTALSPLVSEFSLPFKDNFLLFVTIYFSMSFLGYLVPIISSHVLATHQGYSLYNTGFATGLICMLVVSFSKKLGFVAEPVLIYDNNKNALLFILFYIFTITIIIVGFILNGFSFKGYKNITKHSGRLVADFVLMEGQGLTIINMGFLGVLVLTYLLVINAPLNGITIAGFLSIFGFGSFGKHLKNCIPLMLGVVICAIISQSKLNNANIILATLFSTGLAPIAGHFGVVAGIVAGVLHNALVSYIGYIYLGLNLYNNGFSCGFIAMFLLPILENIKIKIDFYKKSKFLKKKRLENEKNI